MKITTKEYSKLVRETARQNEVKLIKGQRWTDGTGYCRRTTTSDRVVTFKVNTTDGNFNQFIADLTVQIGKAPRFTAPRQLFDYEYDGQRFRKIDKNIEFTYIKFNCEIA